MDNSNFPVLLLYFTMPYATLFKCTQNPSLPHRETGTFMTYGYECCALGIFLALASTRFMIQSLRPFLKISILLIALLLMAQILRRIFGLPSNIPAASEFFKGFRVGGHRGAPKLAPENTIESFEKAKLSGVDLVEFDLTLTKNGIVVIMHDDDLMRTCGEPGLIASFTLEELGTKNAGKTFQSFGALDNETASKVYHIPTLEATVKYCRDNNLKMLFDVKDSSFEMVSQIVSIISSNNLYGDVIVSSFFPWVPYIVKKIDPNILTGVTWRPYFATYKDLECCVPRFSGLKHFLALLLDYVSMKLLESFLPQFLGVEMLLLYEKEVSSGLVNRMKNLDIQVVAWTVNDPRQMLYLVDTLQVPFLTDLPHVYKDLNTIRMEIQNKTE
ncbi:Glycerophosphodiester phosphodiesterase [Dirofilaria immitis]